MQITFQPIGTIHSPFHDTQNMPIQPTSAEGIEGKVVLLPEYQEGLKDLEGFSHIILLYYFHKVNRTSLTVTPFLDSIPRGLFSTRAPIRPNPIGLSIVRLVAVEENILHIENVDILDGTPLIDIKPYAPVFDHHPGERIGWLEKASQGKVEKKRSDDRFT